MADVLALGWGTVTGTRASPSTLLSTATIPAGTNFVAIRNTHATDWLFAKELGGGLYCVAAPGAALTVALGPQSANNARTIVGFATTPAEAAASSGIVALVEAKKIA